MQSEEEWWKDSDNVQALKMLAHSCGSHTKALPDKFNDEAQINQIVLFPTFFPRELFELACAVQMDFNTLMDAVSVDHSFLKSTLDRSALQPSLSLSVCYSVCVTQCV